MSFKAGFLLIVFLAGCYVSYAFPAKDDLSIMFDQTDSSARIVGGTPAGLVPYMVALVTGVSVRNLACGGSLVTTRHVLTAAHCIVSLNSTPPRFYQGYVGTSSSTSGGTPYTFSNSIYHPAYDMHTAKNDIGFLITSINVVLSRSVSLVALNFNYIEVGAETSLTGWGLTEGNPAQGPPAEDLQQLSAFVVDGNYCKTAFAKASEELFGAPAANKVDPDLHICTLHSEGHGTCLGDSGSPLMRADLNLQIGVMSFAIPCARNVPDVFVRLSAYRSWIEETTKLT